MKRVNGTAYVPSLIPPMSYLVRMRTLEISRFGDYAAKSIFHHFDYECARFHDAKYEALGFRVFTF